MIVALKCRSVSQSAFWVQTEAPIKPKNCWTDDVLLRHLWYREDYFLLSFHLALLFVEMS